MCIVSTNNEILCSFLSFFFFQFSRTGLALSIVIYFKKHSICTEIICGISYSKEGF